MFVTFEAGSKGRIHVGIGEGYLCLRTSPRLSVCLCVCAVAVAAGEECGSPFRGWPSLLPPPPPRGSGIRRLQHRSAAAIVCGRRQQPGAAGRRLGDADASRAVPGVGFRPVTAREAASPGAASSIVPLLRRAARSVVRLFVRCWLCWEKLPPPWTEYLSVLSRDICS